MKKNYDISLSIATAYLFMAGGLLHNTNQHIAFMRMVDTVAPATRLTPSIPTPPASAFMDHDGDLSLNIQERLSTSRRAHHVCPLPIPTTPVRTKVKGLSRAPVLPSLYGAYKKDRWTFSGFFWHHWWRWQHGFLMKYYLHV